MVRTYDLLACVKPCTPVVLAFGNQIICSGAVEILIENLPPEWLYGDASEIHFHHRKVYIQAQPLSVIPPTQEM